MNRAKSDDREPHKVHDTRISETPKRGAAKRTVKAGRWAMVRYGLFGLLYHLVVGKPHNHIPEEVYLPILSGPTALQGAVVGKPVVIDFWTGSPPRRLTDKATGTVLAHCKIDRESFQTRGTAFTTTRALATGQAGYFRLSDQKGKVVYQGTVGEKRFIETKAKNADIILDNVSVVVGESLFIPSFV